MSDGSALPNWRSEVKERVKQYRAQRATAVARAEDIVESADFPPNPVLEAALKRLQRPVEELPERVTHPLFHIMPEAVAPEKAPAQDQDIGSEPSGQVAARLGTDEGAGVVAETGMAETRLFPTREDQSEARLIAAKEKREVKAASMVSEQSHPQSSSSLKKPARIIAPAESLDLYPLPAPQPIRPPSQVPLWDRTLAGFLDLMLIVAAALPVAMLTGAKMTSGDTFTLPGILVWTVLIYHLWTLLAAGRTCGMAWRKMRVAETRNLDRRLPLWRIIIRSVASTLAFMLPPLNVVAIWTSGNQASISDLVSGTTLVPHQPQ